MLNQQLASFQSHVAHATKHLQSPEPRTYGLLTRIVGLTIEAKGLTATVGAICRILKSNLRGEINAMDRSQYVDAQVVGFGSGTIFMMPLWEASGLHAGAKVFLLSDADTAMVGDHLLGRVVDALGEPLDGLSPIRTSQRQSLQGKPINPMQRQPIDRVLDVGVKAINAMLTPPQLCILPGPKGPAKKQSRGRSTSH